MANNETQKSNTTIFSIGEVIYWIIASLFMFFVFSNRHYDMSMRTSLSALLIGISFVNAWLTNEILIPRLLFKGKRLLFLYLLFLLVIVSLWLVSIALYLIAFYSKVALPSMILPSLEDVIILLTGTYFISLMSSVFYFTRQSYQSKEEKTLVEQQKNRLEFKLKEVQLQVLKEQIHPHFIFNMMNNLYALVNENTALSREVIVRLSDLLEYMLYECNTDKVELKNEIEFINNYIELERIRHESFNVHVKFPKDVSGIKIAPLILFPFIENAFKHGLKQAGGDFIDVTLDVSQYLVEFHVKNSVHSAITNPIDKKRSKGLGLKNVRERLELLYQNRFDLEICSDDTIFEAKLKIMRYAR